MGSFEKQLEALEAAERNGRAWMRKRAAKLIRGMEPDGFDPRRFVDQIADAVEALPLTDDKRGRPNPLYHQGLQNPRLDADQEGE